MTTATTKMKLLMVRRRTNSRKPTSNASSFSEHAVGTPVTVYYKLCRRGTNYGNARRINFKPLARKFNFTMLIETVNKFILVNPQFSPNMKYGYESSLRLFGEFVKKPWKEITIEDIIRFLGTLNTQSTKLNYLWRIKRFLRWVHDDDLPKKIDRYRIPRMAPLMKS